MNFAEWGELSAEARKHVKWHRRPHIKTATLFSIILTLFVILFIAGIGKNETSHLNRKPNDREAYSMAQAFVKDKLKLPASAVFSKSDFKANIDTANNTYVLSGNVNAQSTNGHFIKEQWTAKLKYMGGDWADRKSWLVEGVEVK